MRKSVKDFGNFVRKDNYPELPEELKEFNYFLSDGETGHVIMAVPEHTLNKQKKMWMNWMITNVQFQWHMFLRMAIGCIRTM